MTALCKYLKCFYDRTADHLSSFLLRGTGFGFAGKDAIRHMERFLDYYRDKMMPTFSLLYR